MLIRSCACVPNIEVDGCAGEGRLLCVDCCPFQLDSTRGFPRSTSGKSGLSVAQHQLQRLISGNAPKPPLNTTRKYSANYFEYFVANQMEKMALAEGASMYYLVPAK